MLSPSSTRGVKGGHRLEIRPVDRRRSRGRWLLVLIVAMAVAGCGGGSSTAADPMPPDASLLARGREVFATSCAECHGADLRGTDQGPSFLSIVYEPDHHADIAFLLAAQRGVGQHHWRFGDMPPVDGVSEEDIAAVAAFVRETQSTEGFEPYPP